MASVRPGGITAIAVFHFVLGGLGLLCGGCVVTLQAIGPIALMEKMMEQSKGADAKKAREMIDTLKKQEEAMNKELDQNAPWHKGFEIFTAAMWIVLPLMMIVAGIGLLGMKSWGRSLSIVYAVLSILTTSSGLAYQTIYAAPAAKAAAQAFPSDDVNENPMQGKMAGPLGFAGPFIVMIYPVIVLIVMILPGTGSAFSRGQLGEEDREGRRDDDDDRRRDDNGGGWAER